MAAGLLPEVIEAFADRFRARGIGDLMPALSGGSGSAQGGEPHFFPGGPIATTLVDGDIKMAGIGTVTWVQGDRFLAFGHPFMGLGRIHMPVSYANIITTVASESGSWKLGRPTTPAGVLTDDRIYAIGGTSAEKASTVPVKVSVAGAGFGLAGKQETFAYQIAKHPTDLPVFAAVVTANTLTSRNQRPQGGTVEIRGTATLSGGLKLPIDDVVVSHRSSPAMQAAFRLMDALGDALNYELAEVDLAALDLKVRHRDDIDYAGMWGCVGTGNSGPAKRSRFGFKSSRSSATWKKYGSGSKYRSARPRVPFIWRSWIAWGTADTPKGRAFCIGPTTWSPIWRKGNVCPHGKK